MNRLQFGPLALLDQARAAAGEVQTIQDLDKQTTPTPQDLTTSQSSTVDQQSSRSIQDLGAANNSTAELWNEGLATLHSSLFIPLHYEQNYAYPLLVYLHDCGQSEGRINGVMPQISCRNYAAVSVRSPGIRAADDCWLQNDDTISQSHAGIELAISKAMGRLNINREKIFLVGEGNGGTMALRLAMQFPENVAGVASINGSLPVNGNPFRRLACARQIPIFWSHYRQSIEFPESELCEGLTLLHTAGFNLTLRQYPGTDCGSGQVYSDLDKWIMEQVTGMSAS